MFYSPKGVFYKVNDLKKAKEWYSGILGAGPLFDTPVFAGYIIGEFMLGLVPETGSPGNRDNVIVYWEVDNIESAHERLVRAGAAPGTEINKVFNVKRATVRDPFGNILGIRAALTDAGEFAEKKPSYTAMNAVLMRALSAHDEREEIRGHDNLAEIFLSGDQKDCLEDTGKRREILNSGPGVVYEYVTARTAYFDNIFVEALKNNIPQIIILGAGYDSRPYRFRELVKDTKIFELDMQATQKRKTEMLCRNNIAAPENLAYASIDFNTESPADVLIKAGYEENKRNLFIWEGVTYYLQPEAVDGILNFIKTTSSAGSMVCFDYIACWPEMLNAYGVRKGIEAMMNGYSGESHRFMIDKGKAGTFLSARGFELTDHLDAEDMEREFLSMRDGSSAGKVVGIYCLAKASIAW